uniref:Cilia- and flagella-associated protein 206 n=1 Tax=Periophthalmus magnuspinnatus TaxID=409849 RepID=A0A3B4B3D4_9GOBI
MLVTGVRLFNRSSMTKDQVELNIQDLGENCLQLVWRYTCALEALTEPGTAAPAEMGVSVELLRQALYNVRQHQSPNHNPFTHATVQRVELLQSELTAHFQVLRDTVQSKRAVPAAQVFPMFRSVSRLWSGLQDEAELLHIFRNLALSLRPFVASQAQIFSENSIDGLLQGSEIKSDAERRRLCEGGELGPDIEWLVPEHPNDTEPQSVQYSGFCGHILVCRDGLLLPGKPQLGLLKYKEKLYAFSSRDSALQFASAPEHYISEVAERAKRSPELIQLLCLHRQFSCVTPYTEHLLVRPINRSSSSTQTDTHPVESYMDRTYEWNEWALRRKALKLADLRRKQTHSTQTKLSHLRRDNFTQTYTSKDAMGQTTQDGESSMPRPLVYLSELRGQRGRPMVRVELTRALDE